MSFVNCTKFRSPYPAIFLLMLAWTAAAQTGNVFVSTPLAINERPDGPVRAVLDAEDGYTFVGGEFQSTSIYVGGLTLWPQTYSPGQNLQPAADGPVYTTLYVNNAQFIGGNFERSYGGPRRNASKYNNSVLDASWQPNPNGTVLQMFHAANTIYMAGEFTSVSGAAANHLAAVDVDTGELRDWATGTNGTVRCMVPGRPVYIAGDFTLVGNLPRMHIAALDPDTGDVLLQGPEADGPVFALKSDGHNTMFAGGDFSTLGGKPRAHVGRFNFLSGGVTAWNPGADGRVFTIEKAEDRVYLGGNFKTVGGKLRRNIAKLDFATGQVSDWNPGADAPVRSLLDDDIGLIAGGDFRHFGDRATSYFAAYNEASDDGMFTGAVTYISGNIVGGYEVGGHFTTIFPQGRGRHLIEIHTDTRKIGARLPWFANIYDICKAGNSIVVGGAPGVQPFFTPSLAKLRPDRSMDASLPLPEGNVFALESAGDYIYVAGDFTHVGGETRSYLARIDANTHILDSWNPQADGPVLDVVAGDDGAIFVAGAFSTLAGQPRAGLAGFDSNGNLLPWSPLPNNKVMCLSYDRGVLLAGGDFTKMNGTPRGRAAAFTMPVGTLKSWDPKVDGSVAAIAATEEAIYLGGWFSKTREDTRYNLASVDRDVGIAWPWQPNPDGGVLVLKAAADRLRVGGAFKYIGNVPCAHYAEFEMDNAAPTVTKFSLPVGTILGPNLVAEVSFSEDVFGFDVSELNVVKQGITTGAPFIYGGPQLYTVVVPEIVGKGKLRLQINPGDIHDSALLGMLFTETSPYAEVNTLSPTMEFQPRGTVYTNKPVEVKVHFGAPPASFGLANLRASRCTISGFSGSGQDYRFTLSPTSQGNFYAAVESVTSADGFSYIGPRSVGGYCDLTDPELSKLESVPPQAYMGEVVRIRAEIAQLFDNPSVEVLVNGRHASRYANLNNRVEFGYRVSAMDPIGPATVVINARDRAGNLSGLISTEILEVVPPPEDLPLRHWLGLIAVALAAAWMLHRRAASAK